MNFHFLFSAFYFRFLFPLFISAFYFRFLFPLFISASKVPLPKFRFSKFYFSKFSFGKLQINLKKNRQKNSAFDCPKSGSHFLLPQQLSSIFGSDFGQLGFSFCKTFSELKYPIKFSGFSSPEQ